MRNLNVSAAQGYRIERQIGDDRPARGGHLQAELIVPSRLAVVDDNGAERMFPYVVERRFADEHPCGADYRERLHGVALELYFACGAAFNVKQIAWGIAVPLEPDVEPEAGGHTVANDSSAASYESQGRIIDREYGAAGTGVMVPADAYAHVVNVHRNVYERHTGRERPADASAANGCRLRDSRSAGHNGCQGERHRRCQRDVAGAAVTRLVDRGAESDRACGSSGRIDPDGSRIRIRRSHDGVLISHRQRTGTATARARRRTGVGGDDRIAPLRQRDSVRQCGHAARDRGRSDDGVVDFEFDRAARADRVSHVRLQRDLVAVLPRD